MIRVRHLIGLALCSCAAHEDAEADVVASHLVETAIVVARDSEDTIAAWGTVAPDPRAARAVTTSAQGTVLRVLVRAGTAVKAGTLLVELRPNAERHLDAARARIDVAYATAELARQQALLEKKLVTNSDVAAAQAAVDKADAEARVYGAADVVSVAAPAAGVVSSVVVEAGDVVDAGASVAVLVSGGALRVLLNVEPAAIGRVVDGQRVHVFAVDGTPAGSTDGAPTHGDVGGSVVQVARQIDAATRMCGAVVAVDVGAALLPGAVVRADIVTRALPQALIVPRRAVTERDGHAVVFVVNGGTAHARAVDVVVAGADSDVISGVDIAAGAIVVTAGSAFLADGAAVRVDDAATDTPTTSTSTPTTATPTTATPTTDTP